MENNRPITKELVEKLISVVNEGLCEGIGKPVPGLMCVEAAVCYAYGLPHDDNPPCVGHAVRAFKIRLNDAVWSSNEARAKGMLALSIAQLNSNVLDQQEFSKRITLKVINNIIADTAKKYGSGIENDLRAVNDLKEARTLCLKLRDAASAADAAYYAARAAAYYAASAINAAAAYYAASAINAAAAYYAARAINAAAASAADAAYYAARAAKDMDSDKILKQAADLCLDVLKEMKSPGCEWLYLINQ